MTPATKKRKIFDNRYEILAIVGRGAASVVYHARHISGANADVALKVLLSGKTEHSSAELLRKEALAMVSARHKYVIRLDDFHSVGDLSYLAMEYAPESDLRKYIKKIGGRLGPIQGQLFLIQMAEALNFAHLAGIIHRDIKPDNILVVSDRETRLADFGVAVLPGDKSSLDDLQKGIGTMSYMAPEVLEGIRYDQRSDIYALGVTFYELLSGVHPFDNIPLMQQLSVRQPGGFKHLRELQPELPEHLTNTIMQALSYDAEARFATARDLVQALLVHRGSGGKPESKPAADKFAPPPPAPTAEKSKPSAPPPPTPPAAERAKPSAPSSPPPAQETLSVHSKPESKEIPKTPSHPFSIEKSAPEQKPFPKGIHPVEPKPKAPAAKDQGAKSDTPNQHKTVAIKREEVEKMRTEAKQERPKEVSKSKEQPKRDEPKEPRKALVSMQSKQYDRKKSLYMIAAIIVFFIILKFVVDPEFRKLAVTKISNVIPFTETKIESPIPQYAGEDLLFPHLPGGMYVGSITGLLPSKTMPLSIISVPQNNQVVVLVGLEGWKPAIVDLPAVEEAGAEPVLHVESSGFILNLTGQIVDGELIGYFSNVISGENGEWSVKAIK